MFLNAAATVLINFYFCQASSSLKQFYISICVFILRIFTLHSTILISRFTQKVELNLKKKTFSVLFARNNERLHCFSFKCETKNGAGFFFSENIDGYKFCFSELGYLKEKPVNRFTVLLKENCK